MIRIPLQAVPSQTFNIVLNEQDTTIHLYQRGSFLYADITLDGSLIRNGAIVLSGQEVIQYQSNFSGYLIMVDTSGGNGTPSYDLLDDRYVLLYYTESELQALSAIS